MIQDLDQITKIFGKVKEFMEVEGFILGPLEANEVVTSPNRKAAIKKWTNFYRSLVIKPCHIIQKLYPVIAQCEAIDAETLKTSKSHLIRQLHSLKGEYDKKYEELLGRLGSLTQEVLLRAFGEHPSKSQTQKVNAYFIELQMEVSNNISKLASIDSKIRSRYA